MRFKGEFGACRQANCLKQTASVQRRAQVSSLRITDSARNAIWIALVAPGQARAAISSALAAPEDVPAATSRRFGGSRASPSGHFEPCGGTCSIGGSRRSPSSDFGDSGTSLHFERSGSIGAGSSCYFESQVAPDPFGMHFCSSSSRESFAPTFQSLLVTRARTPVGWHMAGALARSLYF